MCGVWSGARITPFLFFDDWEMEDVEGFLGWIREKKVTKGVEIWKIQFGRRG